jgi:hypothetical protein
MRGKLVMVLYPKKHTKVMYEGTWRSLKIEKYGFVGSWFVVVVVRAFWFVVGYYCTFKRLQVVPFLTKQL